MTGVAEAHPLDDELVSDVMDAGVLRHLEDCVECRIQRRRLQRFLAPPTASATAENAAAPELAARIDRDLAAVARPAVDGPLARYGVDERRWIGTSARGVAWEVFDRDRQRTVVLKALHDVDAAHLHRVSEALADAGHPNLARWHAVIDGPPLHAVRDLVGGTTLDVELERARRPKALRWLSLVASALCALHRVGVAHGAVRPENVRVDPRGRLVVLDAGLCGPDADPRDDWHALAQLVRRHAPQLLDDPGAPPFSVSGLFGRALEPDPDRRPDGVQILSALALENGLGGLEATRYEVREVVGRGGMGELLRAWDPVLRREVALKRIAPSRLESLDAVRRFQNEARIAAQLQHPNIVPVHELDWGPDGTPFLTMKLVEGRHFGELIDEVHAGGPATLEDAVEVVARLCNPVAFAHGKGVLHLDLKPRNVLVGAYGEMQLVDWGAARLVGEHGVDVDPRDTTDRVVGSPGFMSPEQADGVTDALGPAADVYALGAMLVQVLCGRPPPAEGPCPPAARLAPHAPRELVSITDRALHADPAHRYADAGALGRDLRAWLVGGRVAAHRYGPLELLDLWTRGRRGWIGLGLTSLLAVGTVGWFAFLGWQASEDAARRDVQRQGLVLAEQARLALIGGDRVEAERRASSAVALAGTPEGRGLLARLGRAWYPMLAGSCTQTGGLVSCDTPDGVVRWRPGTTTPALAPAEPAPLPPDPADGHWRCGAIDLIEDGDRLVPADGSPSPQLPARPRPVCSPTGRGFAVVQRDEVDLWRTAPLVEDALLQAHAGGVHALTWSADGARLATADGEGLVHLWDTRKGTELARLPGDATALGFAQRGAMLLVDGETPRAWDLRPSPITDRIEAMVSLAGLGWDGAGVTTLDRQGTWRSWTPAGRFDGDELRDVVAAAGDDEGRAVAALERDAVAVWDRQPLRQRWTRPATATAVAWREDEVLTGGADGVVRRWDALTGEPRGTLGSGGAAVRRLVRVGDRVLIVRADHTAQLEGVDRGWTGVTAATARGERLALGFDDGSALVTGDGPDRRITATGGAVRALSLSPDGRMLAVGLDDRTVHVHVEERGGWVERADGVVDGRARPGLAFSPDATGLAVVGGDSTVELWDARALRDPDPVATVALRYGPDERETP
ncbi:MAG: protein kinase [Alphaproteobacteria bacterium]|nr:protein kinase [Alphaproteobacteria bacterium]